MLLIDNLFNPILTAGYAVLEKMVHNKAKLVLNMDLDLNKQKLISLKVIFL